MSELIEDGMINMAELSRRNGLTELENAKKIIQILAVKGEVLDIPQKVCLTFKEELRCKKQR